MPAMPAAPPSLAELRAAVLAAPSAAHPVEATHLLRAVDSQLEALAASPQRQAVRGLMHARMAEALRALGELRESLQHGLKADTLARGSADPEARTLAILACAHVFHEVGHAEEARRWLAQIEEIEGASADHRAHARMNIAATLRSEGRLAESAAVFDTLLPMRQTLPPELRSALLINAASCLHQLDRTDEAQRMLDEVSTVLPADARPHLWVWTDAIGAWVAARAGRLDHAADLARAALEPGRPGTSMGVRNSAARALGDVAMRADSAELRAEARRAHAALLKQATGERTSGAAAELHLSQATLCEADGNLAEAVHHLRESQRLDEQRREHGERVRLQQEPLRLELIRMQVEAEALRAHHAQLAQANRALLAADTARSRLLATLAHDLRSPLTSIRARTELIDPHDPGDVATHLRKIQAGVDRLVALLDGALSPLDRGHSEISDLGDIAHGCADSFEALAARKGQRVIVEANGPMPVRGSAVDLARLVDNLLSNALKYGPKGGEVRIALSEDSVRVMLRITDDGPGFPGLDPSEGLLFGHRLASRATGDEASFGLGLHTVYQLLAELGGVVALGNRECGGAVVRVTLPRA